MQNIVGIQFTDAGKIYYFQPKNIQFAVGDGVIVETTHGVEYGKIAIANTAKSDSEIVGELKPIIRKATPKDTSIHQANISKGKAGMKDAKQLIAKHQLDMKLVNIEYAFDNSKIVFFFTSDNRVDFRELVKDLAGHFKNRIELRQIGIRDECKQKGGLGPCGKPCCCNSCMVDFSKVSIKMAKNQGLSLNPTKISGLCGRLMCCLSYEDEYYKETSSFMPKHGDSIVAPDGTGVVDSVNMLKQNVKVRMTLASGETETRYYLAKELQGKGGKYKVTATDQGQEIASDAIVEVEPISTTQHDDTVPNANKDNSQPKPQHQRNNKNKMKRPQSNNNNTAKEGNNTTQPKAQSSEPKAQEGEVSTKPKKNKHRRHKKKPQPQSGTANPQ